MHDAPLQYYPGTMRWIEEYNKGMEIQGIRWLLQSSHQGRQYPPGNLHEIRERAEKIKDGDKALPNHDLRLGASLGTTISNRINDNSNTSRQRIRSTDYNSEQQP